MKNGGIFLLLIAGVVGFAVMRGAKNFANSLNVQFNGVKIDSQKTQKSFFFNFFYTLSLSFINPENFKADVTNMSLNVSIGDKQVGTIRRTTLFTIPAKDTVKVDFDLQIPTIQLGIAVKDLISILTSGGQLPTVTVTVDGFLQTALGRIPVNETKQLTI